MRVFSINFESVMHPNHPIYTIDHFSFQYPLSQHVIHFTGKLHIHAGECILLQGDSGSGKSTLLMALRGLIPHMIQGVINGNLHFMGQEVRLLTTPDLLPIGYLHQNPDNSFICRDVYNELAFGLENKGLLPIDIEQKIHQQMHAFKLTHLLNRHIVDLSSGEKQKVNLIAILLREPTVLLLDEPTAFLDPIAAHEVMNIVKTYAKTKTVIIIEHNVHYLREFIHRSIFIDSHGMIHEQPLSDICWEPLVHDFPSKFLNDTSKKPVLTIKALSFAYKNQPWLLHQIDLSLKPGEIIAITGRNGQGKSSLLKLLSGIIPSQQQIYWHDTDIQVIPKKTLWRMLTLLWQNSENHFLHTSVQDELMHNKHLIEQMNLHHVCNHHPFNLSEGEKRRLSLAITLQNNPDVFLLDEPTFGQDLGNKTALAQHISQLACNGKGFIIVSHDLHFIHALTQNIYHLDNGKLTPC